MKGRPNNRTRPPTPCFIVRGHILACLQKKIGDRITEHQRSKKIAHRSQTSSSIGGGNRRQINRPDKKYRTNPPPLLSQENISVFRSQGFSQEEGPPMGVQPSNWHPASCPFCPRRKLDLLLARLPPPRGREKKALVMTLAPQKGPQKSKKEGDSDAHHQFSTVGISPPPLGDTRQRPGGRPRGLVCDAPGKPLRSFRFWNYSEIKKAMNF